MYIYHIVMENGVTGTLSSACQLKMPLSLRTKAIGADGARVVLSGKVAQFSEVKKD